MSASLNDKAILDQTIKDALSVQPSAGARDRLANAIQRELARQNAPDHDILTFDEVAGYLRVTPNILEDYLDDIPCFELGGKLLFRKDAVMDWVYKRESVYKHELNQTPRLCYIA